MVCKLLCLLVLVTFVTQGYGGCDLKSLTLKQSKTGNLIQGKPEWKVSVTNPCSCNVLDVKLLCTGFKSVTTIDPSVLSKSGDNCLLNNGESIGIHADYVFKYVWDNSFNLSIIDATIACS